MGFFSIKTLFLLTLFVFMFCTGWHVTYGVRRINLFASLDTMVTELATSNSNDMDEKEKIVAVLSLPPHLQNAGSFFVFAVAIASLLYIPVAFFLGFKFKKGSSKKPLVKAYLSQTYFLGALSITAFAAAITIFALHLAAPKVTLQNAPQAAGIQLYSDFNVKSSKNFGFDFERWSCGLAGLAKNSAARQFFSKHCALEKSDRWFTVPWVLAVWAATACSWWLHRQTKKQLVAEEKGMGIVGEIN